MNTEYDATPKGDCCEDMYPFVRATFVQHAQIKELLDKLNLKGKARSRVLSDFSCFSWETGYLKGTMSFVEAEIIINYLKRL